MSGTKIKQPIYSIVKAERKRQRLTQQYVADHAHISRATLNAFENGKSKLLSENLSNVLKVLGFTVTHPSM